MIKIDYSIKPIELKAKLDKFWQLSGEKVKLIEKEYDHAQGSPVFTVNGKYSTQRLDRVDPGI
jgi:unsaturated chondroitin disaccharide hydrolase